MKKIIILILTLLSGFGCNQKKPDTATDYNSLIPTNKYKSELPNTRIEGKIENQKSSIVVLSQNTFSDTAQVDKNGNYTFDIYLENPQYFSLKNGNKRIKIFLAPKHNLSISYSSNNVFGSINFSGKGAAPNIYIKDKYLLMLEKDIPLVHLYQIPVKDFRHLVDSLFVLDKMFYAEFVENKEFPEIFKQIELASLEYGRATKLMEYLNTNTAIHKIDKKKYLRFLNKLSVNEGNLLDVYEYKLFLDAFIAYYAGQKTNTKNLYPYEIALVKMQTTNQKIQNKDVKEYMLFTLLKDYIKYYGYKNTDSLFKLFKQECNNKEYNLQLLTPYNSYLQFTQKQKAPNIEMVDAAGNKYTLNSFKGSYIYVDVWASWCLPCRKETSYFMKLKEGYRHKNVVFISLSVDKEKDDWEEYLILKDLNDNQYLATEIKPFLDMYMIKTIPHFLIIDNNGNLIDNNASRPSEIDIEQFESLPGKVGV